MRGAQCLAHVLLGEFIIALIVEPDAVEILRVLDVAHGAEGDVDLPVAVALCPFLHFGGEDTDDGEQHSVEPDALAHSPCAGKQLCLCLRTNYANVRALLIFSAVEEAALLDIELPDVLKNRAHAIHGPGVGVEIVLDRHVLLNCRGDVDDTLHGVGDAINVVLSEANLYTGFFAAGLFAGAPRKSSDD